jgi:hypothetical protein
MAGSRGLSHLDRRAVYGMALRHALLIEIPVVLTAALLFTFWTHGQFAYDFNHFYWPAGDRVLHGLSPYVWGDWFPSETKVGFVYPAPTALVFAGVATIPRGVGELVFTALSLGAPILTLRVLGVRDWRPYGVVFLWPPVIFGWQNANLSLLLVLGVAAIWRYRASFAVSGLLLGLLVSLKLFLWPLGLFFLATRRYSTVAYSALAFATLNAAAWLVLGVDEIPRYRATVQNFSRLREEAGYSVVGFVERLGGDRATAYAVMFALVAFALVACVALARRGQEQGAFILGVAASLLSTPIMWFHYLAFLIVPLALRYPRLHPLWVLPVGLWFCTRGVNPHTWQVGIVLILGTILIAAALIPASRRPAPWRRRRFATAVAD